MLFVVVQYEKNIQIVKEDRKLKELWSWMKRADQISAGLSKVGNVDYSFHGVYGIWTGPGEFAMWFCYLFIFFII